MFPKSAAAALAFVALGAIADPGYYVVTTYPDAGQHTLDFRYWSVKRPGKPEKIWPELGYAYGVNSRWTSELFASWVSSSRVPMHVSSWNWQNDVLLTQGEWPLDVALHTQFVHAEEGERSYELGPALQTDFGRLQVNANLFFIRTTHDDDEPGTWLRYQWQLRYRALPGLHVGAQGLGELGPWDHWLPHAEQAHRAGPALFTRLPLGERAAFDLQAAMLYGKVYGTSARMFSLRAKTSF